MNLCHIVMFSCHLLQFASYWFEFKVGANMGSKQQRNKKIKVLTNEEIATNKEKESQHQWERRKRIRELSNVGSSISNIISEEKDVEDTMMDEETEEENPIQGDLGAHSNQTFNIGVSPNPQFFSHDEIGDFVEVGYDLNALGYLHENRLSNDHAQQTPMEMQAPKEVWRKNENEIQIQNKIKNEMSIENKNYMNVDMETLSTEHIFFVWYWSTWTQFSFF